MYIVAIAWLYVALMMAITESSVPGALLSFIFYGLLPCALPLWIIGTPQRKRNKLGKATQQDFGQPDSADPKAD
jgi:hypothetical protein